MTLDDIKHVRLFSGGQSPWRDELVKVIAAKKFGLKVNQQIHDIDRFGKDERNPVLLDGAKTEEDEFRVTDDFTALGQTPWFSATKLCDFLGPFSFNPEKLKAYGVNTDRLARPMIFDEVDSEPDIEQNEIRLRIGKLHRDASRSGYFGIIGQNEQMIAGIIITDALARKLVEALSRFFLSMQNSASEERRGRINDQIKRFKEDIFRLVDQYRGKPLSALYLAISNHILAQEGVADYTMELTSEFFDISRAECRYQILDGFLRQYNTYADAYNAAIKGSGFNPINKRKREFPYFIAVMDPEGLWGERRTLFIEEDEHVNNLEQLREKSALLGPRVLIIPKAVVLPIEIRIGHPLLLLADGSRYMPMTEMFLQNLRDAGERFVEVRPIIRISLDILDALSAVDETIILPPYLRKPFGVKIITVKDFAHAWHGVYEKYDGILKDLTETRTNDFSSAMNILRRCGYLDQRFAEAYESFYGIIQKHGGVDLQGRDFSRSERRRKKAKTEEQGLEALEKAKSILSREIEKKRLEAAIDALRVTGSLMHWQKKTFYHWVKIFGEGMWLSEIIKRATTYIEE